MQQRRTWLLFMVATRAGDAPEHADAGRRDQPLGYGSARECKARSSWHQTPPRHPRVSLGVHEQPLDRRMRWVVWMDRAGGGWEGTTRIPRCVSVRRGLPRSVVGAAAAEWTGAEGVCAIWWVRGSVCRRAPRTGRDPTIAMRKLARPQKARSVEGALVGRPPHEGAASHSLSSIEKHSLRSL